MLSLHIAKNGQSIQDLWPTNDLVQIEYSGEEGANVHFTDMDTGQGVRIELDGLLIEALYWEYMKHNIPVPTEKIEVIQEQGPF